MCAASRARLVPQTHFHVSVRPYFTLGLDVRPLGLRAGRCRRLLVPRRSSRGSDAAPSPAPDGGRGRVDLRWREGFIDARRGFRTNKYAFDQF